MDWNLESTWDSQYQCRVRIPNHPLPQGAVVGYGRAFAELFYKPRTLNELSFYIQRAEILKAQTPFTPGRSALFVGCGFGYLIEVLLDIGANAIWGTDTSTWIHANKNRIEYAGALPSMRADVQARVANIDIRDLDAADKFKAFGVGGQGKFNWIVTEQVLSTLDDVDIPAFMLACDALQTGLGGVVHFVTPNAPSTDYNSKSITEWGLLAPTHYWIPVGGGD